MLIAVEMPLTSIRQHVETLNAPDYHELQSTMLRMECCKCLLHDNSVSKNFNHRTKNGDRGAVRDGKKCVRTSKSPVLAFPGM